MRIVFYRNSRGKLLALDWLRGLHQREPRRFVHVVAALEELGACGRALGPTLCAHVGGGLYALRSRALKPCPPLLYFFHGESAVVLGPVTRADDAVGMLTLVRACHHRREFERDPLGCSHEEVVESEEL